MRILKVLVLIFLLYNITQTSKKQQFEGLLDMVLIKLQKYFNNSFPISQVVTNLSSSPTCEACHKVFSLLKNIPAKETIHLLEEIATQYCALKKIQIRQVCKGAVGAMTGYILKSVWAKYTNPHYICHKIRLCPNQYNILSSDDYQKYILQDKPNKTQQQPTQRKILNILHLSDIHIDFFYTEGTSVKCDQPVCCRPGINSKNDSVIAGYWGSNKGDCDLPYHTLNLFLEQIKTKNIDAIVWTGDNTAHDIWRQTQPYNTNFTAIISERIKQVLPNVRVMPTIGNHQNFPVNVYDFDNQSNFNTFIASSWSSWIGDQATQQLKRNSFFSFEIEEFDLVVISLNTQAWNDMNWVLIKDPTDPGGMLKWMQTVLRKAQQNQKKVYIVGHIPPNDAIIQWGKRYNAIVDRFSYIIRGQFYGHSHQDHIAFFSSVNDSSQKIIGNYYLPGSLTTYSNKNPNYRIMKVDLDTMRVLDYYQYALKLQKNFSKEEKPNFELTYSFLNEYNLSSLSYENLQLFRKHLKQDPETQIKYSFHTHADLSPGKPSKTLHCQTYATSQLVDKCSKGSFKPSTFEKYTGVWKQLKH